LSGTERRTWRELAPAVDLAGTFTAADAPAFRLMVEVLARADEDMPPSAKVRVLQVCSSFLAAFGLTPASRGKVPPAPRPPPPSPLDEFTGKP
jgi:hypothetical protein